MLVGGALVVWLEFVLPAFRFVCFVFVKLCESVVLVAGGVLAASRVALAAWGDACVKSHVPPPLGSVVARAVPLHVCVHAPP